MQPSDARGRPKSGTTPTDATAVLVTGPQLEGIRSKIRAKYGVMGLDHQVQNKIGGIIKRKRIPYGDRGVLITPSLIPRSLMTNEVVVGRATRHLAAGRLLVDVADSIDYGFVGDNSRRQQRPPRRNRRPTPPTTSSTSTSAS